MSSRDILPPSPGQPQRTGFPCPQCRQFLEFSIRDLLSRSIFRCKHCGLELTLNRFRSRESLDALAKMQGALEQFEAIKRRYSEDPDEKNQ